MLIFRRQITLKLYPQLIHDEDEDDEEEEDIEAAIKKELSETKNKKKKNDSPITSVKMDAQCGWSTISNRQAVACPVFPPADASYLDLPQSPFSA